MQRDYFEDANCIGLTREGDGEHKGCAAVISNKDQYEKSMEMGTQNAGQFFYDALGRFEHTVQIDVNGWGSLTVHAGNVSVWIPE